MTEQPKLQRTLILLKPDALFRELVGTIIGRFERKGLRLVGLKMLSFSDEIVREHYAHLLDQPFFGGTAAFMKSAPVIAVCLEGLEAVATVRAMCGPTVGRTAPAGTIRGDLSMSIQCNLVHASDSVASAREEITRFFRHDELFEYEWPLLRHLYSPDELSEQ